MPIRIHISFAEVFLTSRVETACAHHYAKNRRKKQFSAQPPAWCHNIVAYKSSMIDQYTLSTCRGHILASTFLVRVGLLAIAVI